MKYYYSKITDYSIDEAVERITEALKEEGFGILMDLNIKDTLKEKIDYDFKPYRILGACHPHLAKDVLLSEDKMGTMMPCNVVVTEHADGGTEVAIINPMIFSELIENEKVQCFATDVRAKLRRCLAAL